MSSWCAPCDSRPRMRARAKHDWRRRTAETVVVLNCADKFDLRESGGDIGKNKAEITIRSSAAEYLTYVASVGDQQDSIEMRYEDENIWLTQKVMATLYDVGVNTINYHIKKIFEDSELQEGSVIRKYRITAADGKAIAQITILWR